MGPRPRAGADEASTDGVEAEGAADAGAEAVGGVVVARATDAIAVLDAEPTVGASREPHAANARLTESARAIATVAHEVGLALRLSW